MIGLTKLFHRFYEAAMILKLYLHKIMFRVLFCYLRVIILGILSYIHNFHYFILGSFLDDIVNLNDTLMTN